MKKRRALSVAGVGLCLAWFGSGCGGNCRVPPGTTASIRELVPDELFRKANQGRNVFRPDGMFALPKRVRRVWVDVGAHRLETTRDLLAKHSDIAIVAIEPLAECWDKWPSSPRIVGVPVAIDLERGTRDFHVNKANATSSLAKSITGASPERKRLDKYVGTSLDDMLTSVEVRTVPVLRLEDVLSRIPPDIEISHIKSDVQGFDLQVIKSAGEYLRRVYRIRVEIINARLYEPAGTERPGTEQEMTAYLSQMGFRFLRDRDVAPGRAWLDKEYTNTGCWGPVGRFLHRKRYGEM